MVSSSRVKYTIPPNTRKQKLRNAPTASRALPIRSRVRRATRPAAPIRSRSDMRLVVDDPLAHQALDGLLRAEAAVRRRLSADLEREGLSSAGFSVLVLLRDAGGELELRSLRARLGTSKANATEVVGTLCALRLRHPRAPAHRPAGRLRAGDGARRRGGRPAVPGAPGARRRDVRRARRRGEAHSWPRSAPSSRPDRGPGPVRATSFELVDAQGRVRARLAPGEDGAVALDLAGRRRDGAGHGRRRAGRLGDDRPARRRRAACGPW